MAKSGVIAGRFGGAMTCRMWMISPGCTISQQAMQRSTPLPTGTKGATGLALGSVGSLCQDMLAPAAETASTLEQDPAS